MARATEVVWDGKFIQFMPAAEAATKQAAGEVQIFEGPQGYQPGFYMATKFPLSVPTPDPDPILTSINPTTAVAGVAIANLTLTGTNFTSESVVVIGGVPQAATAFLGDTSLIAANYVPAAAGPLAVLVRTPGHPDTAPETLTITAAPP